MWQRRKLFVSCSIRWKATQDGYRLSVSESVMDWYVRVQSWYYSISHSATLWCHDCHQRLDGELTPCRWRKRRHQHRWWRFQRWTYQLGWHEEKKLVGEDSKSMNYRLKQRWIVLPITGWFVARLDFDLKKRMINDYCEQLVHYLSTLSELLFLKADECERVKGQFLI